VGAAVERPRVLSVAFGYFSPRPRILLIFSPRLELSAVVEKPCAFSAMFLLFSPRPRTILETSNTLINLALRSFSLRAFLNKINTRVCEC
jgi:hypothetical protein